jgi:prephenate dehydrogenase
MKKVSIIGFGRFGKTLFRLIKGDFDIILYDTNKNAFIGLPKKDQIKVTDNLGVVFSGDVIFYCVPINKFEKIVESHKKYFKTENLLIDVLSVKVHPKRVFEVVLKDLKTQALLTHPMFGPDSSKEGFKGLPIVLDKFKTDNKNFGFWEDYFSKKGLKVVELSAEKHDKLSAKSQALAHFIGRGLADIKHLKTPIDTRGVEILSSLMDLTTNDSKELFSDLQKFNPYTKSIRNKYIKSLIRINKQLL